MFRKIIQCFFDSSSSSLKHCSRVSVDSTSSLCLVCRWCYYPWSRTTLRLDLEQRHEHQANEAQCRGEPKERCIWLVWIVRIVASRRRVLRDTGENCGEDAETGGDGQFDGGLEDGAGDGLLRLGQRGHDVHLERIGLAIW